MNSKNQPLKDLKDLFDVVPPEKLKDVIIRLLLTSLMVGDGPNKEACEDIYFLFEFLDKQKKLSAFSNTIS